MTEAAAVAVVIACLLASCTAGVLAITAATFTDTMDYHIVAENTPVGQQVYTLKASNPDGSLIIYEIRGTDYFRVEPQTGEVFVVKPLDRETISTLKFEVVARVLAGGSDGDARADHVTSDEDARADHVTSVPVSVIVLDRNDNRPKFQQKLYRAELSEDAVVGTIVLSDITASDVDFVGDNINVTCDPAASTVGACELFKLVVMETTPQTYSGSLLLQFPLPLPESPHQAQPRQLSLSLVATDGVEVTPSAAASSTTILVTVLDVQNTPPMVTAAESAVVGEQTPVGTWLMKIRATDGDTSRPRPVVLQLVDNPGGYFTLDSESGNLSTAKRLDRESHHLINGQLNLTIKAVEMMDGRPVRGSMSETVHRVTVTVTDINDEPPRFSAREYAVNVSEALHTNTPLPGLNISVSDADLGDSGRFRIRLVDSADGTFAVVPTSGGGGGGGGETHVHVMVTRPTALDYENPNDRKFILLLAVEGVEPSDVVGLSMTSTATVLVTLTDVNDNAPQFSQQAYVGQVSEDSSAGTIITTVAATDRDSGVFGSAGVVYNISGRHADKFLIDVTSGTVAVAPCHSPGLWPCIDHEKEQHFFLTVQASDSQGVGGLSSSVPLKISVLDVNDNTPAVLEQQLHEAVIREGSSVLEPQLTVKAVDPDLTSRLTYSLLDGGADGVFVIDPVTGEVTVNRSGGIDLRDVGSTRVTLVAEVSDGVFSTSVPLTVQIVDTNNNRPKFAKSSYNIVLPESVPVGTVVEHTMAVDADTGVNAALQYAVRRGAHHDFRVDARSGVVTLARRLDYDRRSHYVIQIVAVDSGNPPQTGSTTLTVSLVDSNNKKPRFTPRVQRAEVSETAAVGTVLHRLAARDDDVTAADRLIFSLLEVAGAVSSHGAPLDRANNAALQKLFSVTPDGAVVVAAGLSRSAAAVVTLRVRVTDTSAVPPQSATGRLVISIVGVNSDWPQFAPPWSRRRPQVVLHVREDSRPGRVIARLAASDAGRPVHLYRATANRHVTVDQHTGEVRLAVALDYERETRFSFNVTAFDSGVPQLNSTALVTVHVINVNDNSPVFSQDVYRGSVVEHNQDTSAVLARVSASDADSGEFGTVVYSIASASSLSDGQLGGAALVVDSVSGAVRLSPAIVRQGGPDRELSDTLSAVVWAHDVTPSVHTRRVASARVEIFVRDINDQSPQFAASQYNVTIVQDISLSPPTAIIQVKAVDADSSASDVVTDVIDEAGSSKNNDSSQLRYSIQSGAFSHLFRLHPVSGFLYPDQPMPDNESAVMLRVLASDGVHNDTALVHVTIEPANRHRPLFVAPAHDDAVFRVSEHAVSPGSVIFQAEAVDSDDGDNGRVSYFFRVNDTDVSMTDEFAIDPGSGHVTNRVDFDREIRQSYLLVLVARDGGVRTSHDTVRPVRVLVTDINDHRPQFARQHYRFSVAENMPARHRLGEVEALDADSGQTGRVLYFSVGGDIHLLSVDKHTGVVTTRQPLDRETNPQLNLIVKATNNASYYAVDVSRAEMRDTSLTLIEVAVLDENDSPPRFEHREYFAGVPFDARLGDVVAVIEAIDPDAGHNAQLAYNIRSSLIYKPGAVESSGSLVPSPFHVSTNEGGGSVTCAGAMADYRQHRFSLRLSARELAPPGRHDTTTVHVWVYERWQLVYLLLGVPPETVRQHRRRIERALSNVTAGRVIIDDIRFHLTHDNIVAQTWSDVYIHVADESQLIVDTRRVIRMLDASSDYLLQHHSYMQLMRAERVGDGVSVESSMFGGGGGRSSTVSLLVLTVVLLVGAMTACVCCCCVRSVWRLQAASSSHSPRNKQPRHENGRSPARRPHWPEKTKSSVSTPQLGDSMIGGATNGSGAGGGGVVASDLDDLQAVDNPLWLERKHQSYEEQELSMHVSHDDRAASRDSHHDDDNSSCHRTPSPRVRNTTALTHHHCQATPPGRLATPPDDVISDTYASIHPPAAADARSLSVFGSPVPDVIANSTGVCVISPAGPRVPGVVSPPALAQPRPSIRSATPRSGSRLSVAGDGLPELVAELQ